MPKGPKGRSPPSKFAKFADIDLWKAKPQRKRLNAAARRARKAAAIQRFAKQYARKHAAHDPNDRHYNRSVERAVKQMKPEELDRLLRDDEE